MEHPLNVVAAYPLTLRALILSRAGLWFFVKKSLFVKRHVFLMVTKHNRRLEKPPTLLRSLGEISSHIFNAVSQLDSDKAHAHDVVKQEFVHTEDRNQ